MVGCLKVIKSPNENEKCRTFVLDDQDHTLGNALRYMVMKNPEVRFCGYAIPHPSERKVHLRIETHGERKCCLARSFLTAGRSNTDVIAVFKNDHVRVSPSWFLNNRLATLAR
ncbi:RNA polymerases I and III subunit AC2 l(2)37Cg isoform X1 [Rhipicephalus microplus]|uniref:RNA polymerases I and III subunit AC2 l(2)37Cg isoform X1 n=1 Tax=Rhipicephalus microplus TaxID=6941 RepID=UPI003F6D52AB